MNLLINNLLQTRNLSLKGKENNNFNYVTRNRNSDMFVKSNNVSFKSAKSESNSDKTKEILTSLGEIGIVGAPLIIAVAATTYSLKHQNSNKLFNPEGNVKLDSNEKTLSTDLIKADGDDGIIKIKGTGVNIDADKYDISDPANGVYKNYDGTVDIDLKHDKYIDFDNGIYINPEDNVSAIMNNGEFVPVTIPSDVSFGSGMHEWNLGGSIGPTAPYAPEELTREEFIHKHGETPEVYNQHAYLDNHFVPKDQRSSYEKIHDFFSGKHVDKGQVDIFGHKIVSITDNNGNVSKVSLDDKLQDVVDKYHFNDQQIGEVSRFAETLKLKNSLLDYKPNYANYAIPHYNSVEDFVSGNFDHHHVLTGLGDINPSSNSLAHQDLVGSDDVLGNTDHQSIVEHIVNGIHHWFNS